jgi:hypothetical protein
MLAELERTNPVDDELKAAVKREAEAAAAAAEAAAAAAPPAVFAKRKPKAGLRKKT